MACPLTDFIEVVGLCDLSQIDVSDGTFTQIAIKEELSIPEQKPDMEQIIKVVLDGEITRTKVIETPVRTDSEGNILPSAGGQELTGRKLIIEGKINQKVVYVADVENGSQPVHSAEFEGTPFSTFIVLPEDTPLETRYEVDICFEDVFVEMLSPRDIFKNLIVLFVAKKI
ncbi:DUF3794 domain-containing protein [Sporohalobacter salinus]|uniref:DUF3794 domain-containing protein n=1 Tax=Sporohalobacter salinus TaxID=1494606 RepID=UPI001961179D|nr:DUF3794 domain-containing protein [Sporohalobacter salinus]MBM7625143.1 hypothetical protein [Sporohalobacter salinus]